MVISTSTGGFSQPFAHQGSVPTLSPHNQISIAQSRRVRVQEVWQEIYQQFPDLPKENQYVAIDTGQVTADDTLIGRLIRYHVYVMGRSPLYRLDWKLTLADYLGINEVMFEANYPSQDKFRENPIVGDRAAIAQLNRAQRDQLVTALANIFNPQSLDRLTPSDTGSSDTPEPSNPVLPPQSQPGDAELLLP
ncbi:MAG: hypothetical protein HC835_06120 [Oscillatoriales cyanobacterium RM2_1_1]|nr:hypothetical protein [Oscillatoriales cyanobacterium SM2_3_0]NJO45230.1 hypothetical protein [Oscillatoriales cyanobacterium RM2_1_1]